MKTGEQVLATNRLHEKCVAPKLSPGKTDLRIVVGSEKNDGDRLSGSHFPECRTHRQPIHIRHHNVKDNGVDMPLAYHLEALLPVIGGYDDKALSG